MRVIKASTSVEYFLDFKKAFNAVNHNILPNKLAYYEIRGHANN